MNDFLAPGDWQALGLTLRLAGVTTLILIVFSTPLAWWLAFSPSKKRTVVEAMVALPLVLPPTVIGFYLLVWLGPNGGLGQLAIWLGGQHLAFTFAGLVVGSCIYSLPFAVQPLQAGFSQMGRSPMELGATLGLTPWRSFWRIALPLNRSGYLNATILAFAHTLGEFGVVLMIGGNIASETRVASIAIYEQVETLNYAGAHRMALVLLGLSFVMLLTMFLIRSNNNRGEA